MHGVGCSKVVGEEMMWLDNFGGTKCRYNRSSFFKISPG